MHLGHQHQFHPGCFPAVGGATHVPLEASNGDPCGSGGAGNAYKVAAADVAGKQ